MLQPFDRRASVRGLAHATPLALSVLSCSALSSAGCSFDLEKLYEAAPVADGGTDAGSDVPDDLIELFRDSFALSDACIACALDQCASENTTCRADSDCTAFTECVAQKDTPAQREHCRAEAASWVGEPGSLLERDGTGPLGSCVLAQRCADACGSHEDVSCLGMYTWPVGTSNVTYRLRLTDTNYVPVQGAAVSVCAATNPDVCSGTEKYTSGADGIVDVQLPVSAAGGFAGYLEIAGDDSTSTDLAPQLVRFGWPVAEGAAMNLPIIDASTLVGLTLFANSTLPDAQLVNLDTRGMVQVRSVGCSGVPLSGAQIQVAGEDTDPAIAAWYAGSGTDIVPDFTADQTSDLGAGGTINIPPGRVQIQLKLASSEQVIADMTVPIRAGYITTVLASPYVK